MPPSVMPVVVPTYCPLPRTPCTQTQHTCVLVESASCQAIDRSISEEGFFKIDLELDTTWSQPRLELT